MKLVRYRYGKGEGYGILADNDRVICLPDLAKHLGIRLPKTLEGFIEKSEKTVKIAEELLRKAEKSIVDGVSLPLSETTLLAPIRRPPKVICLGLNYLDHIEERITEHGALIPDEPIIFMKPRTTIIGPFDNIVKPSFVNKLDYEAELAIVIGKKAKNVGVSEVNFCIFGYTILNDVSARDIQFKDKQWTRGKSFDTFAPTGPCVVTQNQLLDTSNLYIRTWVNGELRQNSTTKNMVFNVYQIVHHLSRVMTLEPCDIIATGTPGGVGFAVKPEPKFLQAGDVVRIEIEKIGFIENKVVEEKR
ncbi:MAG: fumarylacetoacetate hydrolase family protein [Nitrososphaerota archaeon]|nr:fumarylacetoacetate hydrolase family protein [Candidatus Bathyarchaeota archaeon]MDW8023169.1 fumarylacetoacetate hydrolase family protein [Nitrososphaerota archaeon]